jgi:hypothetical protein
MRSRGMHPAEEWIRLPAAEEVELPDLVVTVANIVEERRFVGAGRVG